MLAGLGELLVSGLVSDLSSSCRMDDWMEDTVPRPVWELESVVRICVGQLGLQLWRKVLELDGVPPGCGGMGGGAGRRGGRAAPGYSSNTLPAGGGAEDIGIKEEGMVDNWRLEIKDKG